MALCATRSSSYMRRCTSRRHGRFFVGILRVLLGPARTLTDPSACLRKAIRGEPSHFERILLSRSCLRERAVFTIFCASQRRRPWRRSNSSRFFMLSLDLAMSSRSLSIEKSGTIGGAFSAHCPGGIGPMLLGVLLNISALG